MRIGCLYNSVNIGLYFWEQLSYILSLSFKARGSLGLPFRLNLWQELKEQGKQLRIWSSGTDPRKLLDAGCAADRDFRSLSSRAEGNSCCPRCPEPPGAAALARMIPQKVHVFPKTHSLSAQGNQSSHLYPGV